MKMKNYKEFVNESKGLVDEIDIYASIPNEVWQEKEAEIMSYSVDGVNHHDNESRMTHDDDWNVNIRIKKSDLPNVERYTNYLDTRELAEDGTHLYEAYDMFDDILNLPLEQRKEVQSSLEEISDMKKNESMNEGLGDLYKSAIARLKRWVGKKAVAFLINLSQSNLDGKIDMLKMLDPTDLSDIDTTEVIYLGGGIDKTSEDEATGWRDMIEDYFGMDHVVKGEDMIRLAKDGKLNKNNYPKPLIMNPMRNELVRTNDPKFSEIFRKWKAGELDKETNPEEWKYWANVINKEIHAPDLRIVNACDTNLVKLDPAAGAGTLGEMQVSSLRGLNLFVWLDNGYTVKDISPWLIPTITKLVRSDEELQMLLDNIKSMNSGGKSIVDRDREKVQSDPEGFADEILQAMPQTESTLKRYNDFVNEEVESFYPNINWDGVSQEDVDRYEARLSELMELEITGVEKGERIKQVNDFLRGIKSEYPDVYSEVEHGIKTVLFA